MFADRRQPGRWQGIILRPKLKNNNTNNKINNDNNNNNNILYILSTVFPRALFGATPIHSYTRMP